LTATDPLVPFLLQFKHKETIDALAREGLGDLIQVGIVKYYAPEALGKVSPHPVHNGFGAVKALQGSEVAIFPPHPDCTSVDGHLALVSQVSGKNVMRIIEIQGERLRSIPQRPILLKLL